MTLVSNTSPLCYLALIGHAEILPKLYGNVHTTQKVLENHHINVYVTQAGALKRFLICWERLEHYIIGHLILMKGSSRLSPNRTNFSHLPLT